MGKTRSSSATSDTSPLPVRTTGTAYTSPLPVRTTGTAYTSPLPMRRTGTASPLHTPRRHILRACAKHGKHANFVPVHKVSLRHLPVGKVWQKRILKVVQHLACRVVRVRVLKTSQSHHGPDNGRRRGTTSARTCTGLATRMGKDYVIVTVPAHAVLDDIEALHTIAEFFYDNEDCNDVITIKGLSLDRHNVEHGTAQLTCRACPELRQRFRCMDEGSNLETGSLTESVDLDWLKQAEGAMAVLVSHPHGFSKRVTVGSFCGMETRTDGEDKHETVTICGDQKSASISIATDSLATSLSSSSVSQQPSTSSSSFPTSSVSVSSLSTISPSSSSSLPSSLYSASPSKYDKTSRSSSDLSLKTVHDSDLKFQSDQREQAEKTKGEETSSGVCEKLISLCRSVTTIICSLGQRYLRWSRDATHHHVRLYHDAASCPGSSGGALILIGRQVWAKLNESVTSLPVFVHVGTASGRKQGVAVPIVGCKSLSVCFV